MSHILLCHVLWGAGLGLDYNTNVNSSDVSDIITTVMSTQNAHPQPLNQPIVSLQG